MTWSLVDVALNSDLREFEAENAAHVNCSFFDVTPLTKRVLLQLLDTRLHRVSFVEVDSSIKDIRDTSIFLPKYELM